MSAEVGFLAALQLGDSLFPSGGFTLSHGLETLAARGLVRDAGDLQAWLETTLVWQVGPSDGVAAGAAWAAADPSPSSEQTLAELLQIDALLYASKLAREPRDASVRTGRQLLSVLAALISSPIPYRSEVAAGRTPGTHAVALGLGGRLLGLGRLETVLLQLHLHVSSCLGAALRLIDVDDVEAQRIRLDLSPSLRDVARDALDTPWKELYACAPQTELMTMLHERSTVRLFAS